MGLLNRKGGSVPLRTSPLQEWANLVDIYGKAYYQGIVLLSSLNLATLYKGPIHEVFTKVLCGLSGAKVTRLGSYRTCQDEYAVKTSPKAEHGLLYPLEKGFFFLPEPPMLILYEEVEFAGFGSYRREGASKSYRYLDLLVKRKNGKRISSEIFKGVNTLTFSDSSMEST